MRFRHWLNGINPKLICILFFILCSLPVGICTTLLTPMGQAPDEAAHIGRAAGLLHGAILAVRKTDFDNVTKTTEAIAGVKVDSGLWAAAFGTSTYMDHRWVETKDDLDLSETEAVNHHKEFVTIPNMVPYFPTAYVPAAIGFEIGILTRSSPLHCLIIGRFAMFAAFFAIGIAALWLTAYGEAFLLGILLLPMTLFLSGTINQDGLLIGIAVLGCAALTRAADSKKMKWFGLACLVVFSAAKAPYLPMLAVSLLPFREPGFFKRLRDIIIAALPVVIWVGIVAVFVLVPVNKAPYYPGPLYLGDRSILLDHSGSAGNLRILLAHPYLLISLPLQTNEQWGIQHFREMIGILGQLQIRFSDGYYQLWAAAGLIALTGVPFSGKLGKINWRDAGGTFAFVSALILFSYWLVMMSDYLAWTNAGENYIDGLQGRYLIPLLPFLLFALPAAREPRGMRQALFALPVMMLGVYDIGLIPLKLVMSFYLR